MIGKSDDESFATAAEYLSKAHEQWLAELDARSPETNVQTDSNKPLPLAVREVLK